MPLSHRPRTLLLTVLLLGGCGGTSGAADAGTLFVNDLECAEHELIVQGTLNGVAVNIKEAAPTYSFTGADDGQQGLFQATTATASFKFTYDGRVAADTSKAARGFFNGTDSAGAAFDVGNCEAGSTDSAVSIAKGDRKVSVFRFALRKAKKSPYCSGDAVDGELRGCLGPEAFK